MKNAMSKANKVLLRAVRDGIDISENGEHVSKHNLEIKTRLHPSGYFVFTYGDREDRRIVKLHRLQAYKKFGKRIFEKDIVVRHLDGDSENNSWKNIGIGSASDNRMDIPKEKRILMASNPTYNHSEIISDWSNGMSYSEIMMRHNISSKGTVSFIVNKSLESKMEM